jgi:hypothetical protein
MLVALVSLGPGAVSVDVQAGDSLHVVCPVGATSTIQLPEIGFLSVAAGGADRLGIKVESFQEMVLKVSPTVKPGDTTRLAFKGARSKDSLTIEIAAGEPAVAPPEVRYRWAAVEAVQPKPTAGATTTPPSATEAPAPLATGGTVAPSQTAATASTTVSSAASGFQLDELIMAAAPDSIGERQGLPGHRICVLEDSIEGSQHRWYRFRMPGGASLTVRSVEGPVGPIATFRSEAMGKDLRIVVQLDRAQLEKRRHLRVEFSDGSDYSFELTNPSLGRLVRKIL